MLVLSYAVCQHVSMVHIALMVDVSDVSSNKVAFCFLIYIFFKCC